MTSAIIIIISALAIIGLVGFKMYELRSGRTVWRKLGLEKLANWIEDRAEKIQFGLHKWDSSNVSYYVRESGLILLQFYRALQRISAERFAAISNPEPQDHGNRAASFYLKNIKEHKDRVHIEKENEFKILDIENSDKDTPA